MKLVGYRRGLQIRIDHESLPLDAFEALKRKLEFTVKDWLQGKDRFLAHRDNGNRFTTQRVLDYWFHEDENQKNWMMFGHGHKEAVKDLLAKYEIHFSVTHLSPTEVKPLVPNWKNLREHFQTFRHRQREVLQAVVDYDCGIVDCSTGWGKSTVICMLCLLFPEAKIDIICPSTAIIRQIYRDVGQLLFNVGLVGAGSNHQAPRVNCFCSAQSVAKSTFDADLVLVDELHKCATQPMMQQLAQYRNARHWGFTASLRRSDERHRELTKLFGPKRITISYEESQKHGAVSELNVHVHPVPQGPKAFNLSPGAARDRACLWQNKQRNDVIAEAAKLYRKLFGSTIVFCHSLEHLIELKRRLPQWSVAYAPEQTAKAKENKVLEALELNIFREQDVHWDRLSLYKLQYDFRDGKITKVICTGVWKAGIDFPLLRVLIRADGESGFISGTQIPGRVARRVEGEKEQGIVVDFGDEFFEPYAKRATNRIKIYRGHKWTVGRYACVDGTLRQLGSIGCSPAMVPRMPLSTQKTQRQPTPKGEGKRRISLTRTPVSIPTLAEERRLLEARKDKITSEQTRKSIRIIRKVVRKRSSGS